MKEKHNKEQQHDYLATSCWYKEIITDPYQVIAELFTFADIAFYRKLIKGVVSFTYRSNIYRKDDPGSLLYEFKMLESAINAAYLINKQKKESPIEVDGYNLLNKNLYCGRHVSNEWDYFPRSLSVKEYKNPYLVFKNFFKYQKLDKWKKDLQEVLEYSLYKYTDGLELELLDIYFHLTKLIEAAHLIDVREITHVGGRIKNRF